MARIFIDSFESGSFDLWDAVVGFPSITSTSGLDMRGDYCFLCDSGEAIRKTVACGTESFFAARIRPELASTYMFTFYDGNYTTSERVGRIRVESNKITAYVGTLKVATGTTTINTTQTYLMEVRFYVADTSGRIQVWIDGALEIDFTGDTKNGSVTGINRLSFDSDTYIDNIIVDDANRIGNSEIAAIVPNGAGTTTQWTPSAGSNYACVDERPPSDTDYVSVNTVDQIDTYAIGDIPSNIGTIACVQVQARMIEDGTATPQNANIAVRSGGTNYFSADKNVPATYAALSNIWLTNPADSAAWEKADVDAMEAGIRSRT